VNRIKDEFLACTFFHELRLRLLPIWAGHNCLQTRKLDDTKTTASVSNDRTEWPSPMSLDDDLLDMAWRVCQGKLSLKKLLRQFKGGELSRQIETVQNCCDRQVCSDFAPASLKFQHYLAGFPFAFSSVIWNLLTKTRSNFTRPAARQIDIRA